MNMVLTHASALAREDAGSQIVEYALIIALCSVLLALALNNSVSSLTTTLEDLADRVADCFRSINGTC